MNPFTYRRIAIHIGHSGLSDLRKSLGGEADEIYTERARTKRWNEVLRRYDAAEKARRDHELLAGKWKQNGEGIAECDRLLAEADGKRKDITARMDRLRRVKRLAPVVSRMDADAAALRALGPMPDAPAGFAARLGAALEAVESASQRLVTAGEIGSTSVGVVGNGTCSTAHPAHHRSKRQQCASARVAVSAQNAPGTSGSTLTSPSPRSRPRSCPPA